MVLRGVRSVQAVIDLERQPRGVYGVHMLYPWSSNSTETEGLEMDQDHIPEVP